MKKIIRVSPLKISLISAVLPLLLVSCQPGINERELSDLKTKNVELLRQSLLLQSEIHFLQTEVDSLKTVINGLDQQVASVNNRLPALSKDEKDLRQLVAAMHVSWKNLVSSKDPQQILDYFLPRFMANQIDIDTEDKGHVAAFTELDYEKYLESIISRKKFSVEFGDVTFLDVALKDGEFFNLAYKCRMREYKKDVLTESSIVMVSITGRKILGNWKIANYSVVTFEYRE